MDRKEIKERVKMLNSMVEDYLDMLDMEEADEAETEKKMDRVLEKKTRDEKKVEED